jgi:hypothetical protein
MAGLLDFDPEKLKEESASADSSKKWLNAFGGAADALANTQSAADILLKNTPQKVDAGAGFRSAAAAVEDPVARQAKLYEQFKKSKDVEALKREDEKLAKSRDPNSAQSKAARFMAQKYNIPVGEDASAYDVNDMFDPKKMNETEAKARVDFDNAKKLKAYEMGLDVDKLRREKELGLKGAPTADQSKAAGFSQRVRNSEKVMDELAKSGFDGNDRRTWLQKNMMNEAKPVELQKLEQAQRNFINATLRRESGAAISPDEFESARLQYFPQPGEDPEVLEQKRQNRLDVLASLDSEGGGAINTVRQARANIDQEMPKNIVMTPGNKTIKVNGQSAQATSGPQGPYVMQNGHRYDWNPKTGSYE